VKSVTYANTSVSYSTFDAASTETLRVAGGILSIIANGAPLAARSDLNAEGYVVGSDGTLRIRHDAATNIVITFDSALIPPSVSLGVEGTLVAPANVTLSAAASHPNGITKVEFFAGANLLGEDTSMPYEFVWTNVPVGSFTVSAKATNTNGLTATSTSTVTITSPTAAANVGNTSEGNTTDYITDSSGAYINACRFIASADQQLTIINAKVNAIAGKYQCAIYSDVGNAPSALLRATNEVTPVTNGWHTFTLTAPLQATNGTAYWLAIWSNDVNARIHADNGGTVRFAAYPYGTWPNPVNLSGSGSFTYCMYAISPGKTAFQQWKLNNGLPDATSPDSDDDQDGLPLLAEYAFGSKPRSCDSSSSWNAAMSGGQLTLTYSKAKAATDIAVLAEVSGDLVNWSSDATDVEQQWQFLDGTTLQLITARDLAPSPPAMQRFMRIKVTQP
jgi:hypothetical protein